MTGPSDRIVRRFNPGAFQTDDDLRAQFVVRRAEFDLVAQTLRDNLDTPCCQHLLIVGRRGMGKTMLLARAAAEMRAAADLSAGFLPVRFMEESHEVRDIGDFWCETLFYLAQQSAEVDRALSEELLEVHDKLASRWRGAELAHRSRDRVLAAAERLDRKIVLMVENFRTLCEERGWEDRFGWKLRQTLQTEPRIMLLATATTRFAALDDHDSPFYGFFRIVPLDPLDTKECGALWRALGDGTGNGQNLRPLEILTGGNPRLLVIAARFGSSGSLGDLMEQLMTLVDEHTEYFRNHLEGFAKTERRVYVAVLDLWRPSSSQEIADRARLDIRETSSLLRRLIDRGAVEVEQVGKKRRYLAAERLYAIYYKLRRERDDATFVRQLVRFMEAVFTESDFSAFVRSLRVEAMKSPVAGKWVEAARMEPSFAETWEAQSMQELKEAYDRGDWEGVLSQSAGIWSQPEVTEVSSLGAMARVFSIDALLHLERPGEALEKCEEFERTGAAHSEEARFLAAMVLGHKGDALRELGREDKALSCFEDAIRRLKAIGAAEGSLLLVKFHFESGGILVALGRPGEAVRAAERAIAEAEDLEDPIGRSLWAEALLLRAKAGLELAVEQGRPLDGEIAACERIIERFDTGPSPEVGWQVAHAVLERAHLLAFGGHPEDALKALRGIENRFEDDAGESKSVPERTAEAIRADALFQAGRAGEALEIVRRLYSEIVLDTEERVRLLTEVFVRFVVAGAKEVDLLEVLDGDRHKAATVAPLTVALKRRAGQVVRTPREVLQVADDLVEIIEVAMVQDRQYRERVRGDGGRHAGSSAAPAPGTPYSP